MSEIRRRALLTAPIATAATAVLVVAVTVQWDAAGWPVLA
jgi:hypothetical protein